VQSSHLAAIPFMAGLVAEELNVPTAAATAATACTQLEWQQLQVAGASAWMGAQAALRDAEVIWRVLSMHAMQVSTLVFFS
jgi:hypothetical protein